MSDLKDKIENALTSLVLEHNIFASLLARIGVTVVNVEMNALAWTDGKGIYVNEYEYEDLNNRKTLTRPDNNQAIDCTIDKDSLIFVMCHELMHLLNNTIERGEKLGIQNKIVNEENSVKHELWNMATDYEINSMLYHNHENGNKRPIGKKPEFALYDTKYKDMTAEEIYEILRKDKDLVSKIKQKMELNIEVSISDKKSDEDGKAYTSGHELDKHIPIDELTQNEIKAKVDEILSRSGMSAQSLSDSCLNRAMNVMFAPVPFNWRKALSKYLKSFIKNNYTWNKPSRAGVFTDVRLPSTSQTPSLHIGVAIDTSGSVSDKQLQTLMNHVFTILNAYKSFKVDIFCVSTEVHENTLVRYTNRNKHMLKDYKFDSLGGTRLATAFPFIEKEFANDKLDVLLYMTDGQDCDVDGSSTLTAPCPVVWLILDNKEFKKPTQIPGEVYEFNC